MTLKGDVGAVREQFQYGDARVAATVLQDGRGQKRNGLLRAAQSVQRETPSRATRKSRAVTPGDPNDAVSKKTPPSPFKLTVSSSDVFHIHI